MIDPLLRDLFFAGTRKKQSGYFNKVLDIDRANLVAYWMQGEASGSIADNVEGTAARDGAFTGVTLGQTGIGDGQTAPLYDGANDFCNVYSASLNAALNGAVGTIANWMKVSGVGVWTDGALGQAFGLRVSSGTRVYLAKSNGDDDVFAFLRSGFGSELQINFDALKTVDWFHLGATWDEVADEFILYFNGVAQQTLTGLGTWSGNLDSALCNIGAASTVPASVMDGFLAHTNVWNAALNAAQMLDLATL